MGVRLGRSGRPRADRPRGRSRRAPPRRSPPRVRRRPLRHGCAPLRSAWSCREQPRTPAKAPTRSQANLAAMPRNRAARRSSRTALNDHGKPPNSNLRQAKAHGSTRAARGRGTSAELRSGRWRGGREAAGRWPSAVRRALCGGRVGAGASQGAGTSAKRRWTAARPHRPRGESPRHRCPRRSRCSCGRWPAAFELSLRREGAELDRCLRRLVSVPDRMLERHVQRDRSRHHGGQQPGEGDGGGEESAAYKAILTASRERSTLAPRRQGRRERIQLDGSRAASPERGPSVAGRRGPPGLRSADPSPEPPRWRIPPRPDCYDSDRTERGLHARRRMCAEHLRGAAPRGLRGGGEGGGGGAGSDACSTSIPGRRRTAR